MNWQPTKEQLELAALACGVELGDWSSSEDGFERYYFVTRHIWNPSLPTTQGKADLLDLIEAIPLDVVWVLDKSGYEPYHHWVDVSVGDTDDADYFGDSIMFDDMKDKHAALAQAAITVAAMVGEKMKGGV